MQIVIYSKNNDTFSTLWNLVGNASMTYNIGNGKESSTTTTTAIQLTSSNASGTLYFDGYIHYGVK